MPQPAHFDHICTTETFQLSTMPHVSRIPCTPTKRKHIIMRRDQGWTLRAISEELSIPISTVCDNKRKTRELHSYYGDRPGRSRPCTISPYKVRAAVREI